MVADKIFEEVKQNEILIWQKVLKFDWPESTTEASR